jgi:hypothetical protein
MSAPEGGAARAQYVHGGYVKITFRYRAEVIQAIKDFIPAASREYLPSEKAWLISPGWVHSALDTLRWYFDEVQIIEQGQPSTPTPIRKTDPDFAALWLLPGAPAEVVRAAYKALARLHHPDIGGGTAEMQTVNAAYAKLQNRGAA